MRRSRCCLPPLALLPAAARRSRPPLTCSRRLPTVPLAVAPHNARSLSVLALVCRSWHVAAHAPTALAELSLCADCSTKGTGGEALLRSFVRFLLRHGAAVQRLTLTVEVHIDASEKRTAQAATLLEACLRACAAAGALQALTLRWPQGWYDLGGSALCGLTSLRTLCATGLAGCNAHLHLLTALERAALWERPPWGICPHPQQPTSGERLPPSLRHLLLGMMSPEFTVGFKSSPFHVPPQVCAHEAVGWGRCVPHGPHALPA